MSWRLILQSSMLQHFTAEPSRELSVLRKLNNKQRQVSMFLILPFKLLTQLPFVSFLFSLLPFSQSSALTSRIGSRNSNKGGSLRPSFSSNCLFVSFSIPSLLPFSILSLLPFLSSPSLCTIPSCFLINCLS